MLREIRADNASAMTLDGTRTFIVGRARPAIIDPGPDDPQHLRQILTAIDEGGAHPGNATVLLTHIHPDHSAGASALATRLETGVRAIALDTLHEGDVVPTDAGAIITIASPGHTPDHASFHWPEGRSLFCGDLMMGGLDTALVAPPEGNLRLYLESLERIRELRPDRVLPAHGPAFDDVDAAVGRYIEHRHSRCEQVANALADGATLSTDEIAERVYGGEVPDDLRAVAVSAVVAYIEYLEEQGRVAQAGVRWRLVD